MMYMMYQKGKSAAGFTLLEMLVVVVMVGIVASIAAPGWLGFLSRQRMNAARTDLLGVLRTAQTEAESRQQSRKVVISDSDFSVTVLNESASNGGVKTVLGDGEVSDKFNLGSPSNTIIFDSDGRVDVATPFPIIISQAGSSAQSCVIVTTLLGGLKIANDEMCNDFNSNPI